MARRDVLAIVAAACLLLLLTACSDAVPDPRPNVVQPEAVAATTTRVVAADPALSVISGRVLGAGGAPVRDALVLARTVVARTGADGAFTLAVPDGAYALGCTTDGAATCSLRPTRDPGSADLRVSGPVSGLTFVVPVVRRSHPR